MFGKELICIRTLFSPIKDTMMRKESRYKFKIIVSFKSEKRENLAQSMLSKSIPVHSFWTSKRICSQTKRTLHLSSATMQITAISYFPTFSISHHFEQSGTIGGTFCMDLNSIQYLKKKAHLISHHVNSQQWKIKQAVKWDNSKKRKTNNYVCCKWTRMKRKSATEKCLKLRWRIGKRELDTNVHLIEQSCSNHGHSLPQNGISA